MEHDAIFIDHTHRIVDNGFDYHILTNAVKAIKGLPGPTVELGLREGGGTKHILDALKRNGDEMRTHIALDPYGSIPYRCHETDSAEGGGPYPNEMRDYTVSALYQYVQQLKIDFVFLQLEDTEFSEKFANGFPIYRHGQKTFWNRYAFVYFDAQHTLTDTMREAVWFNERTETGAVFVFDDIEPSYYDHAPIAEYLTTNQWRQLEIAKTKASYIKL